MKKVKKGIRMKLKPTLKGGWVAGCAGVRGVYRI
jgi:hypothetical protein